MSVEGGAVSACWTSCEYGGVEHPVSFFSKKFNSYQLNYSEKETLAIVWALQHFEVYINSSVPLTVYTDHNPLVFLNSFVCPNRRLIE